MKSTKLIALTLALAALLALFSGCSFDKNDKAVFSVDILNKSDTPAVGFNIHYCLNDRVIGSFHCSYASNDKIWKGETFPCSFFADDLPGGDLSGFFFSLDVELEGGKTFSVPGEFPLSIQKGGRYSFTLAGSEAGGFTLS